MQKKVRKCNKKGIPYDKEAKRLLTQVDMVSYIMHEQIDEYKNIPLKDIKNYLDIKKDKRYIETLNPIDDTVNGESIEYDVLITPRLPNSNEKIGLYIDLEAQNDTSPGYDLLNRAMYYSSRILSRQKGEAFTKADYNIKKVYSIWICTNPNKEMEDTINLYTFNEINIIGNYTREKDYKYINIIMINLGEGYDKNKINLLNALKIVFGKTNLEPRKQIEILKKDYNINREEKEVSHMSSLGEGLIYKGRLEGKAEGKVIDVLKASMRNIENKKKERSVLEGQS